MTTVDVVFGYGRTPGEGEMRSVSNLREVYGIRGVWFDEKARSVRVEYDATRLNAGAVANLLLGAGLDLRDKVQLV